MKKLGFLLLFISLSALAQTAITTLPNLLTDCKSTAPVNIPVVLGDTVSVNVTVIADNINRNSACPPTNTNAQAQTFIVMSNIIQIQTNMLLASVCTTSAGAQGVNAICVYKTDQTLFEKVNYQYDTTPSTLNGISLSAGNKQVVVTINDPKSANANYNATYQVCYGTHKDLIDLLAGSTTDCPTAQEGTSTTITIGNLDNFTPYHFIARVKSSSNQWTTPTQTATPIDTNGFGEVYNGAPNPLSFSCAQTSTSPGTWILFLILGIFLLRRKTSHLPTLKLRQAGPIVFAILFLFTSPALADLGQINLGIIGSTYKPNLDGSTKADGSPARQFYGTMFGDKLLPLMGVEVDVHLLDDFGSLQLGMGAQYAYAGGNALKVDAKGTLTGNTSPDSAGLHMLHLKPQLTYILDPWINIVPLAPYVRTGIVAMGYMFTYQGGIDREPGGVNPMGFMFGWEAAAGLMLALDWMEPGVSKSARANGAYDHIYLKAEAAYMPINNFYRNGLDFSPAWPKQNLPLMLTFGLVFEFK